MPPAAAPAAEPGAFCWQLAGDSWLILSCCQLSWEVKVAGRSFNTRFSSGSSWARQPVTFFTFYAAAVRFFLSLFLLAAAPAVAQTSPAAKPAELLLVGTFHFHNPGADIAKFKTFDVLAPAAQAELEKMTDQINRFHPSKIFVEWAQTEQAELDEVYRHYLEGPAKYEAYVKATHPKPSQQNFYLKNEIVQLGFRAGKKAGVTKIYALDYNKTAFPFDSVQQAMKEAHQDALLQSVGAAIKQVEDDYNRKAATYTLTQLLLDANTPTELAFNKGFYIDKLNRAGVATNFAGAFLVSEWYRRNLYMYSIVQKTVTPADAKVLVLVGSGHAAMMQEFVTYDRAFKAKLLKDVLQ